MKHLKITLTPKAGRFYGLFVDDQRWITDGRVLALDSYWKYTDRRIFDAFGAGKGWSFNGSFSEGCACEEEVKAIMRGVPEKLASIYPSDIRFQNYRVFLGGGLRVLVNEDYVTELISPREWFYDKKGGLVVGRFGEEGQAVLMARDGAHMEEQFKKELSAMGVKP